MAYEFYVSIEGKVQGQFKGDSKRKGMEDNPREKGEPIK